MKPFRALLFCLTLSIFPTTAQDLSDTRIRNAMKRATRYMMETVSYDGAFVWNYLPDLSRSWGELEARRSMVWIQPPGTPAMGHLLIDAYHATQDEYYYTQACRVAQKLIQAQHPSGGWNYVYDCEGEEALRAWYETIGKSAWRLEEFQHYYGNATFDDAGTIEAAQFLLRLYLEKQDTAFKPALDRCISFVTESQYPIGGWPQRYPLRYDHPFKGMADYSSFITFNDDVMSNNIEFLLQCYKTLDMPQLREPILRALNLVIILQQGKPYAGWADQYTVPDLQPAHARSYEPRSINTATTARMVRTCIEYYYLTGENKFLRGIPDAIEFIRSQQLPPEEIQRWGKRPLREGEILTARFIDPDDGKPLYVHRKGSNVANGEYYCDQDITGTIAHYNSAAYIDVSRLQSAYEKALQTPRAELLKRSPLHQGQYVLPRYFSRRRSFQSPKQIISSLTRQDYWLSPIKQISNPYTPLPITEESKEQIGKLKVESERRINLSTPKPKNQPSQQPSPSAIADEVCEPLPSAIVGAAPQPDTLYRGTMVGDRFDTSPFTPDTPVMGISVDTYIRNMTTLIHALTARPQTENFEYTHPEGEISLYTLRGASGMEARITNFGARIVSLHVPDRFGRMEDVVCGFDSIGDYLHRRQNFGAVVGRYIGRVSGARFDIDGTEYRLQASGNGDCSHGGKPGFANRVWQVDKHRKDRLTLSYRSPDGESGFPGTLHISVTYTLTPDSALRIDYTATTDRPTHLNPSNHSFFNISGSLDRDILDETLWIDADSITEYDKNKRVTGRLLPVTGTPFDFRQPTPIGARIDNPNAQLAVTRGYDHCYQLHPDHTLQHPVARLQDDNSGRILEVYTTEPGLHIYTANGHTGSIIGKRGESYPWRGAICFETMHFADSPNQSHFPSTLLRPGETFRSTTIYKFSVEKGGYFRVR